MLFEIATDDAGLRGRRAGRDARRGAEAAAVPRAAPAPRSRPCCRTSTNRSRPPQTRECRMMTTSSSLLPPLRAGDGPARAGLCFSFTGPAANEDDLLPLGAGGGARRGPALPARQGPGRRHAALLPPLGGRRVRRGRRAAPGRRSSPTSSAEARQAYGLPAPVALGFSNGANIAAAVLLRSRGRWPAPSCCGRCCRSPNPRRRISRASAF